MHGAVKAYTCSSTVWRRGLLGGLECETEIETETSLETLTSLYGWLFFEWLSFILLCVCKSRRWVKSMSGSLTSCSSVKATLATHALDATGAFRPQRVDAGIYIYSLTVLIVQKYKVNLRRVRLVLRWATVSGFNSRCRTSISVCNQPATQANSAFHPSGVGK